MQRHVRDLAEAERRRQMLGRVDLFAKLSPEEREVAKLHAGDFFGERSLLTGEPRSATVVAVSDVECWRLDKEAFKQLLDRRPEIADEVAELLANRQVELARVRDNLSQEAALRQAAESKVDLVGKIRKFFRLEGEGSPLSHR